MKPWRVDPKNPRRVLSHNGDSIMFCHYEDEACLIAAAPEMLAMLEECKNELWDISHSSGDPEDPHNMECYAVTYREVKAVIRKAKGQP